jgi:putative addiction module component (TIGR02574 family)
MSVSLEALGIDRLSVTERLDLIGQIWDSISESSEKVPLPEWHRQELERRRAAAESNPDAGIPWDTVKARLSYRSS